MNKLIKAEFHCHTVYSGDSSIKIPDLLNLAHEQGIERLAITDHNTIEGALLAKQLDPHLIIVGEEIMTEKGELLAYYVNEEIPRWLSPLETIKRLKEQGAFISVPHPFDTWRQGWHMEDLLKILPHIDAMEVFNARSFEPDKNRKAREFAELKDIPMLAGSDAHSSADLWLAHVQLPEFNSAVELREALRAAIISGRMLSPLEHLKTSTMTRLGRINFKKKGD
jgi:predicted metal-dependent phosphoesterase TrpH